MAITVPQVTSIGWNEAFKASQALSFTNPIAAGSIIVVAGYAGIPGPPTSFINDKGDTVTDNGSGIIADGGPNSSSGIQAFLNATTGAQTVTMNCTSSLFGGLFIWEVAGFTAGTAAFDKRASGAGNPITSIGPTAALSQANEFAVAFTGSSNNVLTANSISISPGTSVPDGTIANDPDGSNGQACHVIASVTSALSATCAGVSADNAFLLATISGTVSSGDTLGRPMQLLQMAKDQRRSIWPGYAPSRREPRLLLPHRKLIRSARRLAKAA